MSGVEALLRSMTWDEKLAQMQVVFKPDPAQVERWVRAGVGAVFWPRSAVAVNALQRVAVEQTRLGIPLLVGLDVIHGQRTIAPTPLAMAASFDPDVVEGIARLAAIEAASGGVNWTFSPMIDVSRDPRWGRVVEGFGEDPYLKGALERGEHVQVSVDVSNTGSRDGDEVVQLYVRDLVSSVAQPVRRLIAFARRHVGVGQTITVSFRLGMEQFGFWDVEANPVRFVVEPGTFGLYIGASLQATRELTFEVL